MQSHRAVKGKENKWWHLPCWNVDCAYPILNTSIYNVRQQRPKLLKPRRKILADVIRFWKNKASEVSGYNKYFSKKKWRSGNRWVPATGGIYQEWARYSPVSFHMAQATHRSNCILQFSQLWHVFCNLDNSTSPFKVLRYFGRNHNHYN